jgi:two-component system chemotaxis sensor kinase CheA
MNLDDALHTFIIEARELLEQMEESLLRIEQTPDDRDTINSIFRAAHTIKGSAGLFGLDHVVAFTHVAESLLDKVRSTEIRITSELVALLLAVCDHLGLLVDEIADGRQPGEGTLHTSNDLADKLKQHLGGQSATKPAAIVANAAPAARTEAATDGVDSKLWHLSLRFDDGVLRDGMDPLAFIRYLSTLGRIVHIVTLHDAVPALSELNPDASYLGYEIGFDSTADKAAIEGAFDFVRDASRISILPPHSKTSEYVRLIAELTEEDMRLGEILVACGSLSPTELKEVLHQQSVQNNQAAGCPVGQLMVEQHLVQPQVVQAALDNQKQAKEHKSNDGGLIRVNAEKLDQHINLIGELIIASATIGVSSQRSGAPELLEAASILSRLVEEVRDSALTLRMVQIGATFNKFQRVVRDVSADLGKDIRLEICGAETDLDKTVVEKIGDPLTHLVRNSMDHGIEAAEVRLARGKPAHGTLRLNAYHDAGSIVIEVSDDGGGLNKERILAKAIERDLVKPDQQLSDQDINNLIFEAGFSTAEQVNNLSGRGVGMDVVRRNINALRGTVEIDSTEGVGTTMRIRLPLTLAIIDGFLVGVGASSFVVPLEMVVECVELTPEETEAAAGHDHLNLRGEVLPFIRLKHLFDIPDRPPATAEDDSLFSTEPTLPGVPGGASDHSETVNTDEDLSYLLQPIKRDNVVVVQYAGHRAGLVVENLQGEYQTVIRPLGVVFNGLQGIGGFTILGSGQVALILDVPGLLRRVAGHDVRRNLQAAGEAQGKYDANTEVAHQ